MGINATQSTLQRQAPREIETRADSVSSRVGVHLLADFYGISAACACDAEMLSSCLLRAAQECRLTPLSAPVVHVFPGGGLTAFLPLAESHIALHTYPEREYLALDIFSCGQSDPSRAVEVFRGALSPVSVSVKNVLRGDEILEIAAGRKSP